MVRLICSHCGTVYSRVPSQASRSKYCSRKCHNTANAVACGAAKRAAAVAKRVIAVQPDDYRVFKLNDGQVVSVDTVDYDLAMSRPWFLHSQGYVTANHGEYLHRIIFERQGFTLTTNDIVDHDDHDKLNNRRGNLRLTSHSGNGGNMLTPSRNTSGFKGVQFKDRGGPNKWQAHIKCHQVNYFIGSFQSAEEAAYAYDQWAVQLFGSFAKTNFDLAQ